MCFHSRNVCVCVCLKQHKHKTSNLRNDLPQVIYCSSPHAQPRLCTACVAASWEVRILICVVAGMSTKMLCACQKWHVTKWCEQKCVRSHVRAACLSFRCRLACAFLCLRNNRWHQQLSVMNPISANTCARSPLKLQLFRNRLCWSTTFLKIFQTKSPGGSLAIGGIQWRTKWTIYMVWMFDTQQCL